MFIICSVIHIQYFTTGSVSSPVMAPVTMEGMNRPAGTLMPKVTTVSADLTVCRVVVVVAEKLKQFRVRASSRLLPGRLELGRFELGLDTVWHCRLQKKSCPVGWWLSLFSRFL